MARMRTISQALEYLRKQDPDSAITEWNLRTLLRSGKLKHHKAGNRYLINLDYLEEYFSNPPHDENKTINQLGVLRKVQ